MKPDVRADADGSAIDRQPPPGHPSCEPLSAGMQPVRWIVQKAGIRRTETSTNTAQLRVEIAIERVVAVDDLLELHPAQ